MFLKSTSATKKFSFDLGYLNIFGANTVNRLLTALCGGPRQSAVTKLIQNFTGNQKQSSVKIIFWLTSQIFQESLESLFYKTVSPEACNCTKKDVIAGVFL